MVAVAVAVTVTVVGGLGALREGPTIVESFVLFACSSLSMVRL